MINFYPPWIRTFRKIVTKFKMFHVLVSCQCSTLLGVLHVAARGLVAMHVIQAGLLTSSSSRPVALSLPLPSSCCNDGRQRGASRTGGGACGALARVILNLSRALQAGLGRGVLLALLALWRRDVHAKWLAALDAPRRRRAPGLVPGLAPSRQGSA